VRYCIIAKEAEFGSHQIPSGFCEVTFSENMASSFMQARTKGAYGVARPVFDDHVI
jgi:hypothetical protein